MATCTRFGLLRSDEESPAREMLLVEASSAKDLRDWPKLACQHFLCLLAWDAPASDADIKWVARRLLKEGSVFVGTFGEDCERTHDLIVKQHPVPDRDEDVIQTIWHSGETLEEALWSTLFATEPARAYAKTTLAAVIISIGSKGYADELRRHLADPEGFSKRVLAQRRPTDRSKVDLSWVMGIADEWWAKDFACDTEELRPVRTRVQQHAGAMLGNRGIWMLVAGGAPLVSLPPDVAAALSEVARAWSAADLANTWALQQQLQRHCPRPIEAIIGPAFIGYGDFDSLDLSDARRAQPFTSHTEIARLRATFRPEEWQHGGSDPSKEPTFGVVEGGNLVALAGYRIWNETIAHIAIITDPQHRGRGHGRAAVALAAESALDAGLIPQYRTLCANDPSMAIARRLGFREYGFSVYVRLLG